MSNEPTKLHICTAPEPHEYQVPLSSTILYISATILTLILIYINTNVSLFAIIPLVIIYHGTHEGVHHNLYPREWDRTRFGNLFGQFILFLGFAIVGHNYLLLRWSHIFHHVHGRDLCENTIDCNAASSGKYGTFIYYAGLLGIGCLFHEILGYLYSFRLHKINVIDGSFKIEKYRNMQYDIVQIGVFIVTLFFFIVGGWYYVILRILFMIYWGFGQNVAHYGLEVEDQKFSHIISRTYRVNKFLNWITFGSGFYHLEHHACPRVPGLLLRDEKVQVYIRNKWDIEPKAKYGFRSYVSDYLSQIRGPLSKLHDPREWRK